MGSGNVYNITTEIITWVVEMFIILLQRSLHGLWKCLQYYYRDHYMGCEGRVKYSSF